MSARLTRAEKRMLRRRIINNEVDTSNVITFDSKKRIKKNKRPSQYAMQLKNQTPKTYNQKVAFSAFEDCNDIVLYGVAGTGKTFISMFLALKAIMEDGLYEKLIIVRSTVPARNQGFMPGNEKEKMKVYETPYEAHASDLFGRGDAYEILKSKGILEFQSTSFLRGTTMDNAIILVDEVQNFAPNEFHTIMTRVGKNSRLLICGDLSQDDLSNERYKEISGAREGLEIIKMMPSIVFIEFGIDDILRSDRVKEYIIAKQKYESRKFAKKDESFVGMGIFEQISSH